LASTSLTTYSFFTVQPAERFAMPAPVAGVTTYGIGIVESTLAPS
jgi:hypothetical protein